MSYAKIPNLHNSQEVLLFKEVFCLEKVHGSSGHIQFKTSSGDKLERLIFFAGGAKHNEFCSLFNAAELKKKMAEVGADLIVFGEVYGGKMQGMSKTYGPKLKFIAFDVKVGDCWLQVEQAEQLVKSLGLEFVPYAKVPATIEALDAQRDAPSQVAIRNGMGDNLHREGIVIRPPIEVRKNNGERICAKYKREEFQESRRPHKIKDPGAMQRIHDAQEAAKEYVVPMRLTHVLDKMRVENIISGDIAADMIGTIVKRMVRDIQEEEGQNIDWSKDVEREIGRQTAMLIKSRIKSERQRTDGK